MFFCFFLYYNLMAAVKISFLFAETMMNFSGELSFNQKIITEARPFEAPVLTLLKLKSVKILGLAAA